jgi:hypothetical protein
MSTTDAFYTSPHTGKVYQVMTETRKDYTVYNFIEDGKIITKSFQNDPKYLAGLFGEIEGVYAPWSTSRFD